MDFAITTSQISKVYYPSTGWRTRSGNSIKTAVDNVTLSIPEGELFGLLGPNGAGKTTLVKMLCTLILPSAGRAKVAGIDLADERKIRTVTGLVVSDERSFYWRLSVKRNLDFFAAMHGLHGSRASTRIESVLKDVNLFDRAQQRFSDLSSGMRQRLAIARALLHEPRILFLDEPTRSLDPTATRQLHDLILRLVGEREMTVFLITHDLAEAEKLCDRVALMHESKIQKIGQPAELRRHLNPQRTYTITIKSISEAQLHGLHKLLSGLTYSSGEDSSQTIELQFLANEQDRKLTNIIDYLRQNAVEIAAIEGTPPSLEEVFAHYTTGTIVTP